MPIPSSERIVFQRHPIREVICQLRYPTILRLKTEPPAEFQERVQADYPEYGMRRRTIYWLLKKTGMGKGRLPIKNKP